MGSIVNEEVVTPLAVVVLVVPVVTFVKVILSALTCHCAVGAGEPPVDVAVKVTEVLLPPVLHPATSTGFKVTTGGFPNDKVPEPFAVQPVVGLVITTL